MSRYLARRIAGMIPTLLLLTFLVVLVSRLGGASAVDSMLGDRRVDERSRAELEADLGLNKSIPAAYASYLGDLVRGDLGTSLLTSRSVRQMIAERLNITLELAFLALLFGCTLGTILGVASAILRNSPLDYALRGVAIAGLTIPTFAVGTAVVLFPAIWWGWSPPLFYTSFSDDPIAHLKQFVLPSLIVAFTLMGPSMRLMRTQMLEVLGQDYIRTARAKGLSARSVIARHAARNALLPILTVFGLQVANAVAGSVIMETIFALPGLGRLLIASVSNGDWPVVQGIALVTCTWVMVVNLLVDLAYPMVDPRVKVS